MMNIEKTAAQYERKLLAAAEKVGEEEISVPKALVDKMARGNHAAWCDSKKADGWTYGEDNDVERRSSLLVEFDALPDEVKKDNCRNAREAITLLMQHGIALSTDSSATPATEEQIKGKIEEITESIHDAWSVSKFQAGWKFGAVSDKPNKIHRDLIPFGLLLELYPEDAAYDYATVKGAFEAAKSAGYTICIFE